MGRPVVMANSCIRADDPSELSWSLPAAAKIVDRMPGRTDERSPADTALATRSLVVTTLLW
jgi:hypothetical protein